MAIEVRRSALPWKRVALAAILIAAGSLSVLAAVLILPFRSARMTDDRLVGTWQSDADRTIAGIRQRKPLNEKQEDSLRKLFGKMRVTYTPTTFTTELDGTTETVEYEVLGVDKHSVVIREVESKPSPLDTLEMSEFTVIQFDGPDSYSLVTKLGDIREYFKRVR